MADQERFVAAIDHPGDVCLGETSAQGRQHWEAVDDVTQGTGFDERDAPGWVAVEPNTSFGRHTAIPFEEHAIR
jgi:hypothetical protein